MSEVKVELVGATDFEKLMIEALHRIGQIVNEPYYKKHPSKMRAIISAICTEVDNDVFNPNWRR